MIKKYKNYIIFAVVIVILLGTYFLISSLENEEQQEELSFSESIKLIDINEEDIRFIKIENQSGTYTFFYGDKPIVKENSKIEIDEDSVNSLKYEFSSIYALEKITEDEKIYGEYGLSDPKISLTVSYDDKEYKLYLGNETPMKNGYYMKKNDEPSVYILPSYKSNVILRKLDYYRNTVLFDITADDVTSISYEKKGGNKVSFVRITGNSDSPSNNFTAFKMTEPYNWPAEGEEVSKILTSLNEFAIEDYVSDNPSNIAMYGFDPYKAKINISQQNGKDYEVLLGNSIDNKFYVMVKGNPAVYTVSSLNFSYLDLEPKAYLQLFAYIKNIDTVKKIVYNHQGVLKTEFEIKKIKDESHDIKRDGKNISEASFKEMYTELISTTIGGTLNYKANGTPLLTYEFYFNDGTKDTVNYYKYDDRKIALEINGEIMFYVNKTEFDTRINKVEEIIKNKL